MTEYKLTNQQQERLEAYRKALDQAFQAASDPDMEQRTNRMLDRLDARIEADAARRRRFLNVSKHVLAAACLLVAALLIWRKSPFADIAGEGQRILAFENMEDEVRRVSLPDGTSVCLRNGAVLNYSEKDGMRHAELSGDAYFDVARDSIHPFIVRTSALDLRLLGTAFSVSATPGYSKADVVLERGSLRLQSKSGVSILRLAPNQKAVYDSVTGDVSVAQVSAKSDIQKMYGMASFENAGVEEIVRAIEKQYDIKVDASGYDPTKRYNVSYFQSENAGEVLALLEVLTGGHFSSSNSI